MREINAGKQISELLTEVQRQYEARRDFIAPAPKLRMTLEKGPEDALIPEIVVRGADSGEDVQFGITEHTHDQIGLKLGIPAKYYDRMRENSPGLLIGNINHWLERGEDRYMLRTLDTQARALLSDRFRVLDNFELVQAVLPQLVEKGCKILSCDVTDTRLYIKALSPELTGEIGEPNVTRFDTCEGGIIVQNSEVGKGALTIEGLIHVTYCCNTQMTGSSFRKTHLGRQAFGDFESASEFFSDETRKVDDAAFFLKARDIVAGVLSHDAFDKTIERINGQLDVPPVADPVGAFEVVRKKLDLNDAETVGIRTAFIQQMGDFGSGKWGMANAITEYAKDEGLNYDRAVELERKANDVVELPKSEWQRVAEAIAA